MLRVDKYRVNRAARRISDCRSDHHGVAFDRPQEVQTDDDRSLLAALHDEGSQLQRLTVTAHRKVPPKETDHVGAQGCRDLHRRYAGAQVAHH
jgi:hypothetical protein